MITNRYRKTARSLNSSKIIFGIAIVGMFYLLAACSTSASMATDIPSDSLFTQTPTETPLSAPTKTPLLPSTGSPSPAPTEIQSLQPTETKLGDAWMRPADGMIMSYIPAGEFEMGSEDGDDDENPIHTVYLDAFWIDQTEVTNEMYRKCVNEGKCASPGETNNFSDSKYADHPVGGVLWGEAVNYCSWANDGRLPTEAEWEKAARGGESGQIYFWGDQAPTCLLAQYGNCNGALAIPVASLNPNGYGLYDMAGNVAEWVADRYSNDYYNISPYANPLGPPEGMHRVLRSGGWGKWGGLENALRSADRRRMNPFHGTGTVGFRCAMSEVP